MVDPVDSLLDQHRQATSEIEIAPAGIIT
jgi:hypothetical protein